MHFEDQEIINTDEIDILNYLRLQKTAFVYLLQEESETNLSHVDIFNSFNGESKNSQQAQPIPTLHFDNFSTDIDFNADITQIHASPLESTNNAAHSPFEGVNEFAALFLSEMGSELDRLDEVSFVGSHVIEEQISTTVQCNESKSVDLSVLDWLMTFKSSHQIGNITEKVGNGQQHDHQQASLQKTDSLSFILQYIASTFVMDGVDDLVFEATNAPADPKTETGVEKMASMDLINDFHSEQLDYTVEDISRDVSTLLKQWFQNDISNEEISHLPQNSETSFEPNPVSQPKYNFMKYLHFIQ